MTDAARAALAAYLQFQRALGIETVRIAPERLRARPSARGGADSGGETGERRRAQDGAAEAAAALRQIQDEIGPNCTRCKLHALGRKQVVFGDGDPSAELVFVGEGPGADEDEQGVPFVGRAGQLLTNMIQKGLGLRRSEVYICNVVKCRPPGNRTPEPDECATCGAFLVRQIAAIRPRMVCALGAVAAQALRPYRGSLASVRGSVHEIVVGGWPTHLVVTYHPAYLLRDPSQKKESWKDLQLIMTHLGLPGPAR